ncbi:MAG TPA: isochorismatase family protein [Steroidobacteraceae bacterium]
MQQALIVIDVQESFRHRPYWCAADAAPFLANIQLMIDGCRAQGMPILQIFHQESDAAPTDPFSARSGLVRQMPQLRLAAEEVFRKEVHSALFATTSSGTSLQQWLHEHGIGEILVSGIRTEQCCETTTRHASDLGFKVRFVSDATLTFPMRSRAGREFSARQIREHTELVLDGRFARVLSTAQALA